MRGGEAGIPASGSRWWAALQFGNMRRGVFCLALVSLITSSEILLVQSAAAASLKAQAGLWKISTKAGGLRVPITRCVVADDLADPARAAQAFGHPFNPMVSRMPDPGYHTPADQENRPCKFIELNTTSDSLSYTYECGGQFRSTEQGSVKFDTATHYSADFTFTGDDEMNVKPGIPEIGTEGVRVGECSGSTLGGSNNPFSGQSTR